MPQAYYSVCLMDHTHYWSLSSRVPPFAGTETGQNDRMGCAPRWIRRNRLICALRGHPKRRRLTAYIHGTEGPVGFALVCPCGRKSGPVMH
jgi:hypothetical protein